MKEEFQFDGPIEIEAIEQAVTNTAKAGDFVIYAGRWLGPSRDGEIRFEVGGECVLKLCPGGEIYVNGRLSKSDELVYAALRRWLASATISHSDMIVAR